MIPNLLVFSKICDEKQKKIMYTLVYGHGYINENKQTNGIQEVGKWRN